MLQGVRLVGYYTKVLKGVTFARWYTCRAFCSWVLVLGVLVRGVLAPGVLVLGVAGTGSPGSPRQFSAVVAVCFKGVSWEGMCGRLRMYF